MLFLCDFILINQMHKAVPMSARRVSRIVWDDVSLHLLMTGAPEEAVTVAVAVDGTHVHVVTCMITSSGSAQIDCSLLRCKCD